MTLASHMLRPGQVVRATVTHAEPYGYYLVHEDVQIFAHVYDLPWTMDPESADEIDQIRIGDGIEVTILRLTEDDQRMPVVTFPRPSARRDS